MPEFGECWQKSGVIEMAKVCVCGVRVVCVCVCVCVCVMHVSLGKEWDLILPLGCPDNNKE
jgi:hypothetical protein